MFKSAAPNRHAIHDHPVRLATLPIGFSEPIRFSKNLVVESKKAIQLVG
jgi:hypothetical protein